MIRTMMLAAVAAMTIGTSAQAATEIQWWHAMGGRLGEVVSDITEQFNAS